MFPPPGKSCLLHNLHLWAHQHPQHSLRTLITFCLHACFNTFNFTILLEYTNKLMPASEHGLLHELCLRTKQHSQHSFCSLFSLGLQMTEVIPHACDVRRNSNLVPT